MNWLNKIQFIIMIDLKIMKIKILRKLKFYEILRSFNRCDSDFEPGNLLRLTFFWIFENKKFKNFQIHVVLLVKYGGI